MARKACSEAQQNCEAPANLERAYTRGKCYYCGQPVCMECSQRVRYGRYGRVRFGDDCLIEVFGEAGAVKVYTKLFALAGCEDALAVAKRHVAALPDGIDFYRGAA